MKNKNGVQSGEHPWVGYYAFLNWPERTTEKYHSQNQVLAMTGLQLKGSSQTVRKWQLVI